MEPFELAMKMEIDGEIFYQQLAAKETNLGFKEIFTKLAEDEKKHFQIFQNRENLRKPFIQSEVLKDAGNIFKQLIAKEALNNLDQSQLDLYQQAMELEKKSQDFYLQIAGQTSDLVERALWKEIAKEEEHHYFLLHNIFELVLRPQTWVENGEFVHLEEY